MDFSRYSIKASFIDNSDIVTLERFSFRGIKMKPRRRHKSRLKFSFFRFPRGVWKMYVAVFLTAITGKLGPLIKIDESSPIATGHASSLISPRDRFLRRLCENLLRAHFRVFVTGVIYSRAHGISCVYLISSRPCTRA